MQSAQITLRNLRPSPALEKKIQAKCEQLAKVHPNIVGCTVLVEQPDAHSTRRSFAVSLRVAVPGRELVVDHAVHADVYLAVRDAFAAMRRKLKDAASIVRGEVKPHSLPTPEVQP